VWAFAIAYAVIGFAVGAALLLKFEDRFAERV
jgi:hypothetical protein